MTDSTNPTDLTELSALRDTVRALMPQLRADLEALTRIPSVSLPAFDQTHVDASALATAELLRAEGLEVEIVREGGAPAVIGHIDGPEGAPTVMLYAHHDVQPPGDDADWDSAPFEPTERDGRLYGRGAADDKAGIMAHIAALRAHSGPLPVGVTVFVEGEEEVGSDSLMTILERHGDKLRADAIVLADSMNWDIGTPALTTTLRGLIRVVVTVSTLDHGIHSGMFGGAVPDAITALVRLIATLHDDEGNVAVAGLKSGEAADLDFSEERLREESGLLDGVSTIGSGSLLSRMWTKPVAHDDRHQRAVRREVLQHPRAHRVGQALDADRRRRGARPTRSPRSRRTCASTHPGAPGSRSPSTTRAPVSPPTRAARSTTRRVRRSRMRGAPSRSTSASEARSRSSPPSPSGSPTRRSSSPVSRTPTPAPTAPTSRSTWASSRTSVSPRPRCSPASARWRG